MITVQAPSRLHFGLFSLSADEGWPDAREFGGVGLMVQQPGVRVTVRPASEWSAEGPLAERALVYTRRLLATLPHPMPMLAHQIVIEQSAPEHVGLGTGTQLALAVARALTTAFGLTGIDADPVDLAIRLERGSRSALGIHGFAQGGFLVEAGKGKRTCPGPAPLVARCEFPEPWRIVLVLPSWVKGLHGAEEREAFKKLRRHGTPLATVATLCRLVLLGMLPALAERDCEAFGNALYDFNRRVGEQFAPVQGGSYAHPMLAEVVAFIRGLMVPGVGQSSWGGALFAVVPHAGMADQLADKIRGRFGLTPGEVLVTSGCNTGAVVQGPIPPKTQ
jgi:beta-RFAP synthase